MKLALSLPPREAETLVRLKLLAGLKAGRWRRRALGITWHDTAERELAADGLVLAELAGTWRLERLMPDDAFWPPGAPAPMLAQAATLDRLDHKLPAGLLRLARFDGRSSALALRHAGVPLTLELLEGTIGFARRRRPVCRLSLEGDAAAVREVAQALAAELAIEVSTTSLAAEALAVASMQPASVRRAGAPRLRAGLTVQEAFAHAVGHLTDVILSEAVLVLAGPDGPEPVHQLRVAVRRLRSALVVFRPAIDGPVVEAATLGLKALAERLAPARDLDVFVTETSAKVGEALPEDAGLRRLRAVAERRRRAAYTALRAWLRGAAFRALGITLAALAGGAAWPAPADPTTEAPQPDTGATDLAAFAAHALRRRLRRLTEAGDTIEHLDAPALHAIRLRAKRMRYAAELFAPLYSGKVPRRFLRRLAALQERLGAVNDGAVADELLAALGADTGPRAHAGGLVRGFLAARADAARGRIAKAWQRFRRLEPFWS